MAQGTVVEDKKAANADLWRERMAEYRSGVSVKEFCKERGFSAWSFYCWRKRLREAGPVRFALIDRGAGPHESAVEAQMELVLATGERLRIGSGVEAATLRTVLEALRR